MEFTKFRFENEEKWYNIDNKDVYQDGETIVFSNDYLFGLVGVSTDDEGIIFK